MFIDTPLDIGAITNVHALGSIQCPQIAFGSKRCSVNGAPNASTFPATDSESPKYKFACGVVGSIDADNVHRDPFQPYK
jgi:hypothetical protein